MHLFRFHDGTSPIRRASRASVEISRHSRARGILVGQDGPGWDVIDPTYDEDEDESETKWSFVPKGRS